MKHAFIRFAFAALLPALLLNGCMDQVEDTSGLEANLNFVAVRQADGQYQLGLDYTIQGNTGDIMYTVYIDDEPAVTNGTPAFNNGTSGDGMVFIDVPDPGTGNHTVFIAAKDASGQQAATAKRAWSRVTHKVLVEVITSANCTPCAPANEEYHQRTGSEVAKLALATVKYHVWWPRPTDSLYKYTKPWVEPRVKSYLPEPRMWVAPQAFVGGTTAGNKAADWIAQAGNDQEIPAAAEIILSKVDNGSSVEVGITVRGIATGQYGDLRLYTLVTESEIFYNDGNAEDVHFEVMKRILPDAQGESVSIPNGQEITYTRMVDILAGEVKDNITVVVFLQSESSKTVLQAATIDF